MKVELTKMICKEDQTIYDVMTCINNNTKGIAFIVNETNRIVGVMSDGDIRGLLLNGYGLNFPIKGLYNANFRYVNQNADLSVILDIFTNATYSIKILPIVDDEMRLVDYAEYASSNISLAKPQLVGNEYKYLMDAFLSTWISSSGKYISLFEESFAKYCGVKYGVATSNGTTALHLALLALGIGPQDEVIVPDLTFAATINSVLYTGATPVIVDIEEEGWCIDPVAIEKAVTEKTKAIIVVHLYGQPANMEEIGRIAKKHDLYLIEDCAEAHGAEYKGKKVGSFGIISCFSFYGNKVITTGEGGMCITNDKELQDKMRIYRDHGMSKERRYYHEVIGYNYRMTNLQAAIGTAQTERIDEILDWREKLENMYFNRLKHIRGLTLQNKEVPDRKKIAWLVSVLIENGKRDEVMNALKKDGVDIRAFFVPMSEMKIYQKYAVDCENSKKIAAMGINLPTTYDMNEDSINKIGDIIEKVLN